MDHEGICSIWVLNYENLRARSLLVYQFLTSRIGPSKFEKAPSRLGFSISGEVLDLFWSTFIGGEVELKKSPDFLLWTSGFLASCRRSM